MAKELQRIRQTIFQSRTGDIASKFTTTTFVHDDSDSFRKTFRYSPLQEERMVRARRNISTSCTTDTDVYTGSYAGAGHLVSTIATSGSVSNYGRYLDLDSALARTSWTQSSTNFARYVSL